MFTQFLFGVISDVVRFEKHPESLRDFFQFGFLLMLDDLDYGAKLGQFAVFYWLCYQ